MIEKLPDLPSLGLVAYPPDNADHPMRAITRRLAGLEPGEWDTETKLTVASVFDHLAPEWHTRSSPERTAVVSDALDRGLGHFPGSRAMAVEVGSGIGTYSALVAEWFEVVLSVELSWEMVTRAGSSSIRVRGDGESLPITDAAADAIVLINAFLFPDEVGRVVRRGGFVVWVNTIGEGTPIHLSTDDVVRALPFEVQGVEGRAGAGTWCVLRRDP